MSLCALAVAALAACGGGDGAGMSGTGALLATADTTVAAAAAGTTVAAAGTTGAPDAVALAAVRTGAAKTVTIAAEGQNFLVSGTMTVLYGDGTSWVTKQVTDTGACTNAWFGKDPKLGTVKACVITVPALVDGVDAVSTAALPTAEGGTFYVFGTRTVRYGANGKYVTRSVSGRASCSNAFFANDPIVGTVKSCVALNADGSVAAPVVAAPTGAASAPLATTSPVARATGESLMPVVDPTKIPAPATGYTTARVQPANVADPSQNPVASDIGDFREFCDYSHMGYADPIVYPGANGPHLHVFMGNTGTSSSTTAASLANSGNSTCSGGTLNRTAYWMPAIIDTRDGSAIKPGGSLMYYKQAYDGILGPDIKPFPAGLRMIAGDASSSTGTDRTGFQCARADGTTVGGRSIPPDCAAGSVLNVGVVFPQCWDGVNLDSPDHRSHMANVSGGKCPSTHPVPVTSITMSMNYLVPEAGATAHWRLSSDNYDKSLPGGFSIHGDWFNGWNVDIQATWVSRCINTTMDCHAFLIGDGRILF